MRDRDSMTREYDRDIQAVEAERDAYRKALEEIADWRSADPIETARNALESRVSQGHGSGRTD